MSNLLPLPFKRTAPVHLGEALVSHVAAHSVTTHPDEVAQDAQRLDATRTEIFGADGTPLVMARTVDRLSTYQAQLSLTLEKFPDNAGPAFHFYPLFSPPNAPTLPGAICPSSSSVASASTSIKSLTYELFAALYNLAALYTHLAISHRSTDSDSLKTSLSYFQFALGTLDKLVLLVPSSSSLGDPDFDGKVLLGWREYVSGLAQEVGWQKSVVDRLKNGTISKLALQVAKHYDLSLSHFPPRDAYLPTEWSRYFHLKRSHFEAVAQYRRSLDDLGANRYGDEIGRLTLCVKLVKSVLDSTPKTMTPRGGGGAFDLVIKDCKSFLKVLQDSLARANKDNDLIYLATPTPAESLPEIQPFPLARSTAPSLVASPFEALPRSDRAFENMETKEIGFVLGLWEDRKTNWVRDEVERGWRQRLDRELSETTRNLGLPGLLEERQDLRDDGEDPEDEGAPSATRQAPVPRHVLEMAEQVAALGGSKRLERLFRDVRKVSLVNQQLLTEADQHIDSAGSTASQEDEAFARSLAERSTHFRTLLDQAQTSDSTVRQKYSQHARQIELLSIEDGSTLETVLPPPPPPSPRRRAKRTDERKDPAAEAELTRVKRKLKATMDELKDVQEDRSELLRRLKLIVDQSDIRHEVVLKSDEIATRRQKGGAGGVPSRLPGANGGGLEEYEEVLEGGMEKMQRGFRQDIGLNEKSQRDLLDLLKTLQSNYRTLIDQRTQATFVPSTVIQVPQANPPVLSSPSARQEAIESLVLAHAKYLEIAQNLEEGLKFYADLTRLSSELRDQAKEFAYASGMRRQVIESRQSATDCHEPEDGEEEDFGETSLPEVDPISQAFSKPILEVTPRKSIRKAAQTSRTASTKTTATRTRTSCSTKAESAMARSSDQQHAAVEPDAPLSNANSTVGGGGGGGWDPAMGIRFG